MRKVREQWRRDSLEEDIRRYYKMPPFENACNVRAQAALSNLHTLYRATHLQRACERLGVPVPALPKEL